MVKFLSLSSGSCGNCYFIGVTGEDKSIKSGFLLDAGVSLRRLKSIFESYSLSTDDFSAILVSHDHMDHIRSLGTYCKKLSKPVYSSKSIINALSHHTYTLDHISACRHILEEDSWTYLSDYIKVRYFVVPHDATETIGFAIEIDENGSTRRIVFITDVGKMTDEAIQWCSWADTVILESNYDLDMLLSGVYTHELKMRIIKGSGHLSNDECASAIESFASEKLKNLFLCHLSENNNTPKLAYDTAKAALANLGVNHVSLRTLPRRDPSPLLNL